MIDEIRMATVREFRDQATKILKSKTPTLVTRRGKLAGVYVPTEGDFKFNPELRQALYSALSHMICQRLETQKISEEEVLEDFEATREPRR